MWAVAVVGYVLFATQEKRGAAIRFYPVAIAPALLLSVLSFLSR
ncbi:hypothetical protein ACJ5NV_10865 [Loktanella agnita]